MITDHEAVKSLVKRSKCLKISNSAIKKTKCYTCNKMGQSQFDLLAKG